MSTVAPRFGSPVTSDTPLARYQALVADGSVTFDPAQSALAEHLDELARALAGQSADAGVSPLHRLLRRRPRQAPRGLYVYGDVGRGKTMLVDLFFETVEIEAKRRMHFNDFMADVHERIHRHRQRPTRGRDRAEDPIAPVAGEISGETRLVCLDELHVDDIADAMIVGRLFSALFAGGVVVVATSNVPPDGLYANGLNRQLFLPFVQLLKERMEVVRLEAALDYRLDKLRGAGTWFAPADGAGDAEMDVAWRRLTGIDRGPPTALKVKGRELRVPQAHMGVARFSFGELCEAPLGPNDFLALARAFHTLLIDRIPMLRPNQRNAARRFVLLIDILYDNRVKLVASADADPDALYPQDGPLSGEFRRAASRLHEMRSEAYLAAAHGGPHDSG